MKTFIEEHGKILIISVIGLLCFTILFFSGAFMDMIDNLKPANPDVRNEATKNHLTNLASRAKPKFVFRDPQLQLGDSIEIKELILEVKDADGNDLKDKVEYYQEDGRKVNADFQIKAYTMEEQKYRFYVEDSKGIYADKKFAIIINNTNDDINDAAKYEMEWDIGVNPGSVAAKIFTYEENGIKKTILYITGNGKTMSYQYGRPPWTRDGYNTSITECIFDSNVITEDLSNWFKDFIKLEKVPEFFLENGIKNMSSTFENCTLLKSGYIPVGVTNISGIYKGCTKIKTMSAIPSTVDRMSEAFYGCVMLRGNLVINAYPSEYNNCFYKVASQTNGISLKVYNSTILNEFTVKQMVNEALSDEDTNIIYLGQKD
ncbi:hypothetical protein [uncultured Robinsoniella sp.]|uniref:hypothetical protein n=1 Tax=uncultured Robinsoniella sp. TaxID=904190 RepID=UPI00374F219B